MHCGPLTFPAGSNAQVVCTKEPGLMPKCAETHGFSGGPSSFFGAPVKLVVVLVPQSCTENGASLSLKQLANPFIFHLYLYDLVWACLALRGLSNTVIVTEHFLKSSRRS